MRNSSKSEADAGPPAPCKGLRGGSGGARCGGALHQQAGGVKLRALETGVHGMDTVAKRHDKGGQVPAWFHAVVGAQLDQEPRMVHSRAISATPSLPLMLRSVCMPAALVLADCSWAMPKRSLASSGRFRPPLVMPF